MAALFRYYEMIRIYLTISLLLSSTLSLAGPSEEGLITHLQVFNSTEESSDKFVVKLDGSISESTCSATEYWYGKLNDDAGKTQYSTLLAASMTGKKVRFEAISSQNCSSAQLLITNVYSVF
jgi:hypothetical protein